MPEYKASILFEVDATELFEVKDRINWTYCLQKASFTHKEACEFILHIGEHQGDYMIEIIKEMETYGCTSEFIDLYKTLASQGATRILLFA